jgi:hypothetical protein
MRAVVGVKGTWQLWIANAFALSYRDFLKASLEAQKPFSAHSLPSFMSGVIT